MNTYLTRVLKIHSEIHRWEYLVPNSWLCVCVCVCLCGVYICIHKMYMPCYAPVYVSFCHVIQVPCEARRRCESPKPEILMVVRRELPDTGTGCQTWVPWKSVKDSQLTIHLSGPQECNSTQWIQRHPTEFSHIIFIVYNWENWRSRLDSLKLASYQTDREMC